jgi:hypothetical protein
MVNASANRAVLSDTLFGQISQLDKQNYNESLGCSDAINTDINTASVLSIPGPNRLDQSTTQNKNGIPDDDALDAGVNDADIVTSSSK